MNRAIHKIFLLSVVFTYCICFCVLAQKTASTENKFSLYKNCGNYFSATKLGIDPSIDKLRVIGGECLPDRYKEGYYYLVPDSSAYILYIKRNYDAESVVQFNVLDVPMPEADILLDNVLLKNGKPIELKNMGINLAVRLTNDAFFEKYFPKDSRIKVGKAQIKVTRGEEEIYKQELQDGFGILYQLKGRLQKGDVLWIEIQQLKRANYKHQVFPLDVSYPVFQFKIK